MQEKIIELWKVMYDAYIRQDWEALDLVFEEVEEWDDIDQYYFVKPIKQFTPKMFMDLIKLSIWTDSYKEYYEHTTNYHCHYGPWNEVETETGYICTLDDIEMESRFKHDLSIIKIFQNILKMYTVECELSDNVAHCSENIKEIEKYFNLYLNLNFV